MNIVNNCFVTEQLVKTSYSICSLRKLLYVYLYFNGLGWVINSFSDKYTKSMALAVVVVIERRDMKPSALQSG